MPPPLFVSCNHPHISLIPALVIQDLELQPGPDGQIVHGNLMFSRATEG